MISQLEGEGGLRAARTMTLKSKSDVGGFFFLLVFFFLLPVRMSVVLLKTSKMPGGELALAVSKALPGRENKWVENTKQNKRGKQIPWHAITPSP